MMMNINIHRTGWAFYTDLPTQFVNIACNFNETTFYFRLTFFDHQISLAINFVMLLIPLLSISLHAYFQIFMLLFLDLS